MEDQDAQTFSSPLHPYYPLGVRIPGYVPNSHALPTLLAGFGGALGGLLLVADMLAKRYNPRLSGGDLGVFSWFVLCGLLHCVFEGYFILNHTTLASSQHPLAQLWKEYTLSDSRYLVSDPFVVSIEGLTVFLWGPLCLLTALSIVRASPHRHGLQILSSMAHLYGVALYYATSLYALRTEGVSHSRPEALYFWVYFVGTNAPWGFVPLGLLLHSFRTLRDRLVVLEQVRSGLEEFQMREGFVIDNRKTK